MKIRIAIVDDNTFLIKAVEEKLSFFDDLEVKFSSMNGLNLLQDLEENSNVDLILMDIEMPVMNGIEATEKVKQKYPQIKIIMLTVFDNDENIFNAIKAGADGYLLKEINAADFEFEKAIAHTNRKLSKIETVFLLTASKTSFISSSIVRDVIRNHGDYTVLVPDSVRVNP